MTGQQGDEFLNTADRRSWIHDATGWVDRPPESRLVGFASGKMAIKSITTAHGTWTDTGAHLTYTKHRSDTDIVFTGHISAVATDLYMPVTVWTPGGHYLDNQWPPTERDVGGSVYFQDQGAYHQPAFFHIQQAVSAGQHTAMICVQSSAGTIKLDQNDFWAIQAFEVPKR